MPFYFHRKMEQNPAILWLPEMASRWTPTLGNMAHLPTSTRLPAAVVAEIATDTFQRLAWE
jgi:hypothetical protein